MSADGPWIAAARRIVLPMPGSSRPQSEFLQGLIGMARPARALWRPSTADG
jgi:hypothetical protein